MLAPAACSAWAVPLMGAVAGVGGWLLVAPGTPPVVLAPGWVDQVLEAVLLGGDGEGHGRVARVTAGGLALHVLRDQDLLVGLDLEVGGGLGDLGPVAGLGQHRVTLHGTRLAEVDGPVAVDVDANGQPHAAADCD